jgi:hypothetical protein
MNETYFFRFCSMVNGFNSQGLANKVIVSLRHLSQSNNQSKDGQLVQRDS